MAWKIKEENYITIGWRGAIIGASKNRLGACYARKCDRATLPPRTDNLWKLALRGHLNTDAGTSDRTRNLLITRTMS